MGYYDKDLFRVLGLINDFNKGFTCKGFDKCKHKGFMFKGFTKRKGFFFNFNFFGLLAPVSLSLMLLLLRLVIAQCLRDLSIISIIFTEIFTFSKSLIRHLV